MTERPNGAERSPNPNELVLTQIKLLFGQLQERGLFQGTALHDLPDEGFGNLLDQTLGKIHGQDWDRSARTPQFVQWVKQQLRDEAELARRRAARDAAHPHAPEAGAARAGETPQAGERPPGISEEEWTRRNTPLKTAGRTAYRELLKRYAAAAEEAQALGYSLIEHGKAGLEKAFIEEALYVAPDDGGDISEEELDRLNVQDLYNLRDEVRQAELKIQEYRARKDRKAG